MKQSLMVFISLTCFILNASMIEGKFILESELSVIQNTGGSKNLVVQQNFPSYLVKEVKPPKKAVSNPKEKFKSKEKEKKIAFKQAWEAVPKGSSKNKKVKEKNRGRRLKIWKP